MVSPKQEKVAIKKQILSALNQKGKLDLARTLSEFSLQTGFTEKTVMKILLQMQDLEYIVIDGNIITRPAAASEQEVEK